VPAQTDTAPDVAAQACAQTPTPATSAAVASTPVSQAADDQVMGHQAQPVSKPAERRGLRLHKLDWPVVIGIALLHLGCIAAPFYFSWSGLAVSFFFAFLSGPLGVTLCFHRMLTHRSFTTPAWFRYLLTFLGCTATQGAPIQWVGTHRLHHKHSDSDMDPHTPNHGFTWSHVFWCMHKHPGGMPWSAASAAQDLARDPGLRLLNKYHILPQITVMAFCFAGGWISQYVLGWNTSALSWLVWGVAVRTVCVYHGTWFVNSASHTWGYKNYETGDRSTNLWWVALLSFGEGWHNNHHGDQRAAAHGRRWFEFDPTYWTIRLLEKVGLARDVVRHKPLHG